ncbi:dethiobiotin synthase [Reichenbachiella carrageenanivorans]|uniref:ATP-dependent dethiobiotin synthetase BioD n=1 Tax=Reichenbachiella carrageenanivorans TaxID=2979869 RepID=A0ABY6D4Y1_9BACT|nr:dethiobiotin synthase [Reichenbachiella carrageenanivorans]UXX81224.1 dethiobiotin synthase [Reichenbachiella carrageenanivorans]
MKKYFVTGIDTDSGKTVASAILVEKLKADYWKPIQAGQPTDSDTVRSLISNDKIIHPEGIVLDAPMSPHAAAQLENIELKAAQFQTPETNNTLIIEGAGGLLVPINDSEFVIDLAKPFDAEVILVSRNYLGSINHTMLSINYLQTNNFKIAGIIFNDTPNPATESFILNYSKLPCLGRIEPLTEVNKSAIQSQLQNISL